MDDNTQTPKQTRSWRVTLQSWLQYLKEIFSYAIVIAALIGASFLITGRFSSQSYSDRLFMGGIIVTSIGVFIFITMAGTRRRMGIPTIAKNEDEARKIMDHTHEFSQKAEKRYDVGSKVWAVGIACLVLSVLLYFVLFAFGI